MPLDLGALEDAARAAMAPGAYDYLAGGAEDERTLADNVAAWDRIRLRPRILRNVSAVDTTTTVLGATVAAPVLVAPTAAHQLCHRDGELATAAGAAAAGTVFVLSSRCSKPVPEVAAATAGAPWWFQVYVLVPATETERLLDEAVEGGASALVLTGDTPLIGRRRRDERNAFDTHHSGPSQDPAATFDHIAIVRERSGLPVLVKGVVRADDARRSVDAGAAGVIVSNHGGRQLDGTVATADVLPEIVAEVGDDIEVHVDGGVRRGADVVRALALGARAVHLGRPVLWGLATGGADGVRDVLEGFRSELARDMALCGATTLADVTDDLIWRKQ